MKTKYDISNDADRRRLEELSNELLDAAYQPTAAAIEAEAAYTLGADALETEISKTYEVGRIMVALDEGDKDEGVKEAIRLAGDNIQLVRFVARYARYKRGKGQQINRPGDLEPHRAAWLDQLLAEADLLRQLWRANGISVKGPKDAAIQIVISRARQAHRVTPDSDLPEWLKEYIARRPRRASDDEEGLRAQLISRDKNRARAVRIRTERQNRRASPPSRTSR